MTILEKRLLEYFSPLVQEFVRDVDALKPSQHCGMPEAVFALFGQNV